MRKRGARACPSVPSRVLAFVLVCGCFASFGHAAASGAMGNEPPRSAVVAACANPRLPAEILDGRVAPQSSGAPPAAALPVVDAAIAQTTLRLAVADDAVERERGLMCVTGLRPRHGMVFVFADNAEWEFWMKNTLVPLDMVWLDSSGTVTAVAANVPAATRTTPERRVARRRGHGSLVIELPGREAALDGIVVGAHVALPPLRAAQ